MSDTPRRAGHQHQGAGCLRGRKGGRQAGRAGQAGDGEGGPVSGAGKGEEVRPGLHHGEARGRHALEVGWGE